MVQPEKIKEARKLLGLSQAQAALMSNLEQKDISMLESGKKRFIPGEYIQFLYNSGIDLNSLWNPNEKVSLIEDDTPTATIEQIPSNGIDHTNTPGTKTKKTTGKTTGNTTPNLILAPHFITVDSQSKENILYVNAKAAAGYLNGYSDREYIENLPSFNLPGLNEGTYRSFEVSGESMYPTLENKEMVIGQWLGNLDSIREDRIHIIVTKHDGIIIKRLLNRIEQYGYIIAKSDAIDNRNLYPNLHIYPDDILEVWYGVWHGSFNFKAPAEVYKRVNNLEADMEEIKRVLGINPFKS